MIEWTVNVRVNRVFLDVAGGIDCAVAPTLRELEQGPRVPIALLIVRLTLVLIFAAGAARSSWSIISTCLPPYRQSFANAGPADPCLGVAYQGGLLRIPVPLRASPAIADDIHLPERRTARFHNEPGEGTPRALRSAAMRRGDQPATYCSKIQRTMDACSVLTSRSWVLDSVALV